MPTPLLQTGKGLPGMRRRFPVELEAVFICARSASEPEILIKLQWPALLKRQAQHLASMTLPALTRKKHPLSFSVKNRLLDHSVPVKSMLEKREERREGVTHHYTPLAPSLAPAARKGWRARLKVRVAGGWRVVNPVQYPCGSASVYLWKYFTKTPDHWTRVSPSNHSFTAGHPTW